MLASQAMIFSHQYNPSTYFNVYLQKILQTFHILKNDNTHDLKRAYKSISFPGKSDSYKYEKDFIYPWDRNARHPGQIRDDDIRTINKYHTGQPGIGEKRKILRGMLDKRSTCSIQILAFRKSFSSAKTLHGFPEASKISTTVAKSERRAELLHSLGCHHIRSFERDLGVHISRCWYRTSCRFIQSFAYVSIFRKASVAMANLARQHSTLQGNRNIWSLFPKLKACRCGRGGISYFLRFLGGVLD